MRISASEQMWTVLPVLVLLISIVRGEDACKLEPDSGPCRALIQRWFFNQTTKACESFIYGGCQGTVPFNTKAECQAATCDPCVQRPETGPCRASLKRYFFNNRKRRCQVFRWGGCRGVVPFETFRECRREKCVPNTVPKPSPVPLRERCSVKPDPGPCRKKMRRWFWDEESHTCKSFTYGGCFGTVPFRWRGQCRRAKCGGGKCSAKPDPGPCKGAFPRWYYNSDTDECESFLWGGCKGTAPFATKAECEASPCIKNRCGLEPDPGPCEAAIKKYFFNQETGKCESFTWGGCFGSVPYDTLRRCERAKCQVDKCRLRKDSGPCDALITKWWFDPTTGRCESFEWGGCGGRVPFETEEECLKAGCMRNPCKLKPETGLCRAFFLKWFWNEEFGRCESFIWGGCGGVVPFDTEVECEEAMCGGVDFGNNNETLSEA